MRGAARTLRAATADVPDHVRQDGARAVDLFRDEILLGASLEQARAYINSPAFKRDLRIRNLTIVVENSQSNPYEKANAEKELRDLLNNHTSAHGFAVSGTVAFIAFLALLEVTDKVIIAVDAIELTRLVHSCTAGNQSDCDAASSKALETGIIASLEITAGSLVPGSALGAKILSTVRKKVDPDTLQKLDDITPNGTLTQIDNPVDLTNGRSGHILINHRAGAGKAGKTEFPSNWDDQRVVHQVVHQVSDISTDPNLARQVDSRGTPYVVAKRDGVEIRVNFFPDNHARAGQIATAYPTE